MPVLRRSRFRPCSMNARTVCIFRIFRSGISGGIDRLSIGRLGRVTLLGGRNGVGKTTVIEAVRVHHFADFLASTQ